jgi:hypothetical protein
MTLHSKLEKRNWRSLSVVQRSQIWGKLWALCTNKEIHMIKRKMHKKTAYIWAVLKKSELMSRSTIILDFVENESPKKICA